MISAQLIEHIFKAASISRWNDYPKMTNLVELDKQAHKFIIAYFIAKLERDVDMNYIIEAGIFEFLTPGRVSSDAKNQKRADKRLGA